MSELYNETPELSTTSDNSMGESIMPENPDIGDSGFFAILPANVLYDSNLTPNAKLLYAAITTMTKRHGYCYASNKWFAKPEHFDKTPHTISQWVAELEQHGYIRTEITHRPNGQILGRKIYTSLSFSVSADDGQGMYKNLQGYVEKSTGVCTKIYSNNNSSNININNNNKKSSGRKKKKKSCPYETPIEQFTSKLREDMNCWPDKIADQWSNKCPPLWTDADAEKIIAAFGEYINMREESLHEPVKTGVGTTKLYNKLAVLSDGLPEYMLALIRKATLNCWRGFWPLNDDDIKKLRRELQGTNGRDKEWL